MKEIVLDTETTGLSLKRVIEYRNRCIELDNLTNQKNFIVI